MENPDLSSDYKAKLILSKFGPTGLFLLLSLTTTAVNGVKNHNTALALLASSESTKQLFNQYRAKNVELHGKEADAEIITQLCNEHYGYRCIEGYGPDRIVIFEDAIYHHRIKCYEREMMQIVMLFNRDMYIGMDGCLSHFYELAGMDPLDESRGEEDKYWIQDGWSWLDVSHTLLRHEKGVPVYSIDFVFEPMTDYELSYYGYL